MAPYRCLIILINFYLCHVNGFRVIEYDDFPEDEEVYYNHTASDLNIRVANPDEVVNDIAEFPYMASIQQYPGHQDEVALNAVFVAASWVFTLGFLIDIITDTSSKKKHLVVISGTLNQRFEGKIHRVKKIVFSDDDDLAVLKTSGEIHPFIPPVRSRFVPGPTESFTLLRWDLGLQDLLKNTDVNVLPSTDCLPGYMCIDSIPLTNILDVCAPLISSDNKLVAIVYTPLGGAFPFELMVPLAPNTGIIREMIRRN